MDPSGSPVAVRMLHEFSASSILYFPLFFLDTKGRINYKSIQIISITAKVRFSVFEVISITND